MRSVAAICFLSFALTGLAQAQTPLITSGPASSLRNNYTGFVGTQFTVGSTPIKVTALGRFGVAGSSNSLHTLKIVDAQTGLDVPGTMTGVNAFQLPVGSYGYSYLPSAATLQANHSYYLVSQEMAGGDQWYDFSSVTANLPLAGSVYTDAAGKYVTVPNTAGTSYVGPNMQYETTSQFTPDTVTITAPTNGQVLTGGTSFNFTATITPADAPYTQNFYFSIDGQAQNSLYPSYNLNPEIWAENLDPGFLLNGPHTIIGTYLPSAGAPIVTAPVSFTVTNGAYPLVTNQTPGAARNNFSGFVGMQFQTPSAILQVTALGRYVTAGNSGTHQLKLVDAATGVDVQGASVAINLNGAIPGSYVYGVLPSTVVLLVNHPYYLVSQETAGGDQWADIGPVITSNIGITGPVYQTASGYALVPDAGYSYVPVNLGYKSLGIDAGPAVTITAPTNNQSLPPAVVSVQATIVVNSNLFAVSAQLVIDGKPFGAIYGSPYPVATYGIYNNIATLPLDVNTLTNGTHSLAVQVTDTEGAVGVSPAIMVMVSSASAPMPFVTGFTPTFLRNNFTGLVGTEFTVGPSALNVTALGRYCVAGNSGTHSIYLYSPSGPDAFIYPLAQVSVSMANCSPGQYVYAAPATPLMLSPATSYYLADQETAGGDFWYDFAKIATTNVATVSGSAYSTQTFDPTFTNVPATSTSYVPLNFLYDVAGTTSSTLAVSIDASTTSTSVTVDATSNVPITSVQVQVDGYSITAPMTTAPYTQALPNLNFGNHTITAIAKDSGGNTQTSAPFVLNVRGLDSSYPNYEFPVPVMNITPGAPRNNYTGWVGFQFTTGTTYPLGNGYNIQVNQPFIMSRICAAGNVLPHVLKIVVASTGQDLPNGSAWVNCGSLTGTGDRLGETFIGATLQSGTTYYLVSQETAGGDSFTDVAPATPLIGQLVGGPDVPYWSNFTIDGPVYFNGVKYVLVPVPNNSYASLMLYGATDPI